MAIIIEDSNNCTPLKYIKIQKNAFNDSFTVVTH